MKRVKVPVPMPEAKARAMAYLRGIHHADLAKASSVAGAIWPDNPFRAGQGAGAAASRILRRLINDGHAEWHSTDTNWGYRATPAGREAYKNEA
jgi:hypothetical protein